MSWRIVAITKAAKISTQNNYLIIETDEVKKVFIEEIDVLLIESNKTLISVPAINILAKNNVNVIYCDNKYSPYSFSAPIYGNHLQSKRLMEQIKWGDEQKDYLWTKIVEAKINNQYNTLRKYYPESAKLGLILENISNIKFGDSSNREGMVAKIYFKEMFGKEFVRTSEDAINAVLNYAYAILASSFSRTIISRGYSTDMGIHHKSIFNHFNLTYDLLEPYRPIIDYYVTQIIDFDDLDSDMKRRVLLIFNNKVVIDKKKYYINNSIEVYLNSVFDVLNGKRGEVDFPLLENHEL